MMNMISTVAYSLVERLPSAGEYLYITDQLGWTDDINDAVIPAALAASLFGVVAEIDGVVVGMGRIVGDTATFFYIQDVAVIPAFQGIGVESAIMDQLMMFLEENAPDKAVIGVFASCVKAPFYEQFGFSTSQPHGMYRVIDRANPDQQVFRRS